MTAAEVRRNRLEELITQHGGVLANLNQAMGYARNDTRLARIRNANSRSGRPGKVFAMGDKQARELEDTLGLERGWMDTPPGYHPGDTRIEHVIRIMQAMEGWQKDAAVKVIAALAEPPQSNGTDGGRK